MDLVPLVKEGIEPGDVHLETLEPKPFLGLPLAELRLPATRLAKGRFDFRMAGNAFRVFRDPGVDPLLQGCEGEPVLADRLPGRPHRLLEEGCLTLLIGLPPTAL